MHEHESGRFPAWAEKERAGDLAWIGENLNIFWPAAQQGYEKVGRGAIVIDTTQRPTGEGHPFGYFSQEMVEQTSFEEAKRMVGQYDPAREMVTVLLKTDDRLSAYRVGVPSGPWEAVANEATPGYTREPAAEPKLKPPDVEMLIEWEAEGGCEAACPHGCWVEPDGTCTHGNPSWLLKLGLI